MTGARRKPTAFRRMEEGEDMFFRTGSWANCKPTTKSNSILVPVKKKYSALG
jgi:hypothetical protein